MMSTTMEDLVSNFMCSFDSTKYDKRVLIWFSVDVSGRWDGGINGEWRVDKVDFQTARKALVSEWPEIAVMLDAVFMQIYPVKRSIANA